jgi:bifunctional non-homologous end joining protein LigD
MKQIAEARDAEWQSNREERNGSARSTLKSRIKAALKKKEDEVGTPDASPARTRGVRRNKASREFDLQLPSTSLRTGSELSLPSAKPRFIEPMKPRLVDDVPGHGDWLYELKFDGIRAIAVKDGAKVNLVSRNENELRARFPEIADAIRKLPIKECVIDGEVVALDEAGRSSFQLLQALEMEGGKAPVRFYVFDLLQLEGKSLLKLPVEQRKQLLAKLCNDVTEPIRYSGEIGGDAKSLLAEVKKRGLEGLIGKLRDSLYEPGRRSGAWIKLKCVNEQEFVIGGYTPPGGSRKYFGAILVGYYDDKKKKGDSRLKFAGKVGSGFTSKSLSILHKKFEADARDDCPFVDLPSKQGGQWVQGITPSMMKKMHWVNPKFVAQIKFAEWTRDEKLRQPVFLGLRQDKSPNEVTRES